MTAYEDGGRWRYRFRFRGKRYGGTAPTSRNLKSVAARMEREHIDRLVSLRFEGEMPTVKLFAETYLEYQRAHTKPLTVELHENIVNNHVVPALGPKKLDVIGARDIADLTIAWQRKAAPRTINTRLGILARMLSLAVEWEMLQRVPPFAYLKIGKEVPRFLSDAEAAALIAVAPDKWRAMVVVALRAGLRIGELRGLQWGDVDFGRDVLVVRRTDPGRSDMAAGTPKGGAERTIALSPAARLELQRLKLTARDVGSHAHVWAASTWRGKTRKGARSEGACQNAMERMAKAAGCADTGWHTLRHTCASHLVMRGIGLRWVQQVLGHESIKQTERYAHLAPDFALHAAMATLDIPLPDDQLVANRGLEHVIKDNDAN